jgi:hypothetical protein
MKDKLEILDLTLKTDTEPFLSKDWLIKKVLKLNNNEVRMYKMKKIWEIK